VTEWLFSGTTLRPDILFYQRNFSFGRSRSQW